MPATSLLLPRNILAGLVALSLAHAAAAPNTVPNIAIGGGETDPHTHLRFEGIPKDAKLVRVSTHLIVERAATNGLNFFAVQVNFPNQTWAHGGPQVNSGAEKANWGGLVNRGGGSKDYEEVNWQEDLKLIECGIDKPNTVPWKWERDREYILTVERGQQVKLPAGTNAHFKVSVPERTMWRWNFTIQPVDGKEQDSYSAFIYDSADHFRSFYLWNESGYGSTSKEQHTKWSLPTYRTADDPEDKVPAGWKRF
ncbi:MAG TPA: hypothetical protein VFV96_15230 [Verrucomicrobiae bacterium]|nr:hypothetical protein [Verrucomicrobiae bacterium]